MSDALLAQADPGTVGTVGIVALVFSVVVGPAMGVLIWVVRHLLSVTIPGLQKAYHDSLTLVVAAYREEGKEQREAARAESQVFREELSSNREALAEAKRELIEELRKAHSGGRD